MDPFGMSGIPNLGQIFSPLGGGNFGANPFASFNSADSMAAMRCGCQGGTPMQGAGMEQMLMQQMQMNNMLLQMLTMLIQLMGGKGMMPGGMSPGGSTGASDGGMSPGGSAGASGGSPSGPGMTAPPADPNTQIPAFGANPSKQQLNQQIEAAATKYGIPPDILKAIFYKESNWNPAARGDGGKSYGIGQVYTTAHPDYDIARGQQDVSYQIDYSAKLLSGLYKQTGNWRTAVRRYNGSGPMAERYADDVMNNLVPSRPWTRFGV